MAIIDSIVIGTSKKSMGNMTLRKVRGRTIGSKKIMENLSSTAKQSTQRNKFKEISQALSKIGFIIDQTFDKSKYGSARNNFFKINKDFLQDVDGLADAATPFDLIKLFATENIPYIAYGEGNGTVAVSAKNTDDQSPKTITFTTYGIEQKDLEAVMIIITATNIAVQTVPAELFQYDPNTKIATYTPDTAIGNDELAYQVNAVITPNGFVKNPYICKIPAGA